MSPELSLVIRGVVSGYILGFAAGGTWLLPRRDEFRSFAAIVTISIVFGFIGTGWHHDAAGRRLAFDLFAATLALGGLSRRALFARLRRSAARGLRR